MNPDEQKKKQPTIATSAESHYEAPENIPDTLVVPPNTIYLIPDHESFINPPHFQKAGRERDWFTQFFYFCLPLTFGSQHGFLMKATYDFVIRWNGKADTDSIEIHLLEKLPRPNYVELASHFGHGILTVQSRYSMRTPKGVNLMVKAPPNYYVDGLSWLDAVVEADNLRRDFTFNIKVTRPNTDIYIAKGTPLGCVLPYPRYFLDAYVLEELKDSVEVEKAQRTISYFAQERGDYDHGKPRLRYMEGKDIYNKPFEEHQKTLDGGQWWQQVKQSAGCPYTGKTTTEKLETHPTPPNEIPLPETAQNTTQPPAPVTNSESHSPTACPEQETSPVINPKLQASMYNSNIRQSIEKDHIQPDLGSIHSITGDTNAIETLNRQLVDNLITIFLKPGYDAALAPVRADKTRAWTEEDAKTQNHAKFCLPLQTASGVGHFLLSPATFTVEWDGNVEHDATIEIIDAASHTEITTHSAAGSFTVQSKIVVRTKQPGDYVYVKGIANQFRLPYSVLEAMIEAWWAPTTFGIVCILNQAGKFKIEKGQPLAQFFAVSREKAEFDTKVIAGEPPRHDEWLAAEALRADTGKHYLYFKGQWPDSETVCPHYVTWGQAGPAKVVDTQPETKCPVNHSGQLSSIGTTTQTQEVYDGPISDALLTKALKILQALNKQDNKEALLNCKGLLANIQEQNLYQRGTYEALLCLAHEIRNLDKNLATNFSELAHALESEKQKDLALLGQSRIKTAKENITRLQDTQTRALFSILQSTGELGLNAATKLSETAYQLETLSCHDEAANLTAALSQILQSSKNIPTRQLLQPLELLTYIYGRQGKLHENLYEHFNIYLLWLKSDEHSLYFVASSLNNLAFSYKAQGHFAQAEICFKRALEQARLVKNGEDKLPRFLEDLAFFYKDQLRLKEAEECLLELINLKTELRLDGASKARSHTDLAFVLTDLKDFAGAKTHFTKALKVLEEDNSSKPLALAQQLDYLAFFYQKQNIWQEAVKLLERALEIRQGILPKNAKEITTNRQYLKTARDKLSRR
jgi:tetratricopeptide (TPR) repeat protein